MGEIVSRQAGQQVSRGSKNPPPCEFACEEGYKEPKLMGVAGTEGDDSEPAVGCRRMGPPHTHTNLTGPG